MLLTACSDGGEPAASGASGASGSPSAAGTSGSPAAAGSPGGSAQPGSAPPSPGGPSPSPSGFPLVPEVDEAKQPKNAAEARALLGKIAIAPGALGPEVARSTPFESDPNRWPVLDGNCVWQTAGLPADVLATRTQYFHIPAKGSRGRVRINTTVTIHHTREESGWETARAMEEVLRCPTQRLREGEELRNLWGGGLYLGEQMNAWTEDAFSESGEYVSTTGAGAGPGKTGEPQHYTWSQGQFGPVTVAVAIKGAPGYTPEELQQYVVQGTSDLMLQAKQQLGKAAG
ncbi:hypothetical protein DEJ50_02475 [Streptomyces venezuelae]|uniref:Uncharacterized protein n=1 Tax=Streptomyces venezuelae TaxID=54571 RepID=A0A5P2CWS6_STRVZ|nr:hypothetical protein DEJ50_02475 [Streptomyces venezuelae]